MGISLEVFFNAGLDMAFSSLGLGSLMRHQVSFNMNRTVRSVLRVSRVPATHKTEPFSLRDFFT